jgi:translation initiation factor 3 subunit A
LKEQQELERKVIRLAKNMDHLERARREEEVPYLEEAYKKQMEEDKSLHEELDREMREKHRAAWDVDVVEKHR